MFVQTISAPLRSDGCPMPGLTKPQLGDVTAVAQSFAYSFYHSRSWERTRAAYLNSLLDTYGHVLVSGYVDGNVAYFRMDDDSRTPVPAHMVIPPGMCERCFRMGEYTPATLVHHIKHLTPENIGDPSVSLDFANLMRVCADCHAYLHSDRSGRRVTFDDAGDVVVPDPEHDFREQVMRLTETVDERRNIHRRH